MQRFLLFVLFGSVFVSCSNPVTDKTSNANAGEIEIPGNPEKLYSTHVQDTFQVFAALPAGYRRDSTSTYPLIILLDGNAFFEPAAAEIKFNSYIGMLPDAIVVGVGYRDFATMDSLRSRDYTFPFADPSYEMTLSGGAEKFRQFINNELLPSLTKKFRIDPDKMVLCGHSLGGYFVLYYGLKSIEESAYPIPNLVSASPSLFYNDRYLFAMEKKLSKPTEVPLRIYVSMGSEDMKEDGLQGILQAFGDQVTAKNYPGLRITVHEYSNFGHLDAALPGFMKGLGNVLAEEEE